MKATIEALKGLHAALIADGFDPRVDALQLSELVTDGLALLDPLDEEGAAEETLTCACERASAGVRHALKDWPTPPTPQKGPRCGHSACSQNYIDTGDAACVAPLWTVTVNGYRVASVRAETDDEAQDLALSGFDAEGDEVEWEDETTDVTVESVDD